VTATKELFFYAPTEQAAAALAHALQTEAGFMVPEPPHLVPAAGDVEGSVDRYGVQAYAGYSGSHAPSADAELDAIFQTCDQLAAIHGAVFDGSGEVVADLATYAGYGVDTGSWDPRTIRELWERLGTGGRIRGLLLLVFVLGTVGWILWSFIADFAEAMSR
jgi:hypothetical protein